MDIPIGVLYDTIVNSLDLENEERLPFKITTFYQKEKETSDDFLPSKVWQYFYQSSIKENMLYRTGSARVVFDKIT